MGVIGFDGEMKAFGKIFSWLWFITFGAFFVFSFVSKDQLPAVAIEYREQFRILLDSFLSSIWFVVVFIFMWLFVMHKLAKDGGWKMLAKQYSPAYVTPAASSFSTGSGYIGKTSYNGVLRINTNSSGLYLKVFPPFNIGHKPLFITWSDISKITSEEALVPDKTPVFLRKIAKFITRKIYKKIELSTYPDQRLIVQWKDSFDELIPSHVDMD